MSLSLWRCRCGKTVTTAPGVELGCCTITQLDAYMLTLLAKIDEFGWAVQGVFPTENEPDAVPFAYTVGLTTKGQPEVIVYGLPATLAQSLLNDLGTRMAAGERIELGRDYDDVIANDYSVRFIPYVGDDATAANALYPEVTVIEMCLPDVEHRFRWDAGYEGRRRR